MAPGVERAATPGQSAVVVPPIAAIDPRGPLARVHMKRNAARSIRARTVGRHRRHVQTRANVLRLRADVLHAHNAADVRTPGLGVGIVPVLVGLKRNLLALLVEGVFADSYLHAAKR